MRGRIPITVVARLYIGPICISPSIEGTIGLINYLANSDEKKKKKNEKKRIK